MRETDPQELRRTLRHIAVSTERATHLINQLLALARAEYQGSDPSRFEVIDLVPVARDLVRELVAEAIARQIDLGFEEPERPARVVAAPMLVREMLKNLLDNALRYTPRGGSVTVRIRTVEGSVYLEVEDNGPGIPEGERQRVFDRFYRILGTNVDGSGLGLAIVREIAEQHDALIRIGSSPGKHGRPAARNADQRRVRGARRQPAHRRPVDGLGRRRVIERTRRFDPQACRRHNFVLSMRRGLPSGRSSAARDCITKGSEEGHSGR